MKKTLLTSLVLSVNFIVFADENKPDVDSSETLSVKSPIVIANHPAFAVREYPVDVEYLQTFSLKAQELIQNYKVRITSTVKRYEYSPIDFEKHINEEYRPAWEELFRESITNSYQIATKLGVNPHFVANAFYEIASTNSIPMLFDVYTQLLEKNKGTTDEMQKKNGSRQV